MSDVVWTKLVSQGLEYLKMAMDDNKVAGLDCPSESSVEEAKAVIERYASVFCVRNRPFVGAALWRDGTIEIVGHSGDGSDMMATYVEPRR